MTTALEERSDGFAYDYSMRCECGAASPLTAIDYAAEVNGAHMDCTACGADIHFGRAVVAIRDNNDPALDDTRVPQLAWYHSSTWADWPSPAYADHVTNLLAQSQSPTRLGLDRDRLLARETGKALHVGTYEAAVENMLRRMRDQADSAKQFHLYRVQLRSGLVIEPGYRDENLREVAQIAGNALTAANIDAIRYLNAYEAAGTLSMAVTASSVVAVQHLPLPPTATLDPQRTAVSTDGPHADHDEDLARALVKAHADVASRWTELGDVPMHERRMMTLGLRPDPTGAAHAAQTAQNNVYELWDAFERDLTDRYLATVSPTIVDDFRRSLATWRREADVRDPSVYATRYADLASLLTGSDEVIANIATQPWRHLPRPDDPVRAAP